ncbi:Two component regulator propeller [Marivirga sericea]|uniref:histidine kinase n=1 Tax=Marivirga sericea TaxID=1028 RepID=A0A1X7K5L5_9BACT|nr:triple tyrosine motif-containing protein [Marivirga sericea]SMG36245.1 Two component regulator propeller [Marivirga sericea]
MQIRLFLFLLIVFSINSTALFCQKFDVRHIDYSYGLSSSNMTTINQDRFGFIWIGTTHGGLYRWDGVDLKSANEDLSYSYINDILFADNENKYICTFTEISKLENTNQIRANIDLKPEFENQRDRIAKLFKVKNRIIVFTYSGWAFILDSKSLKLKQKVLVAKDFYNYRIIQSDNSFLLFNTNSSVQLNIDADSLFSNVPKVPKKHPGSRKAEYGDAVYKYSLLSEDQIFMQTDDSLFALNQKNLVVKKRYSLDLAEPIYSLLKIRNEWWIGTKSGLYLYVEEENQLKLESKILGQTTKMLYRTSENIWAATMVGFFNIHKKKIQLIEDSQFQGPLYSNFVYVNNSVWSLSYFDGIKIYEKGVIKDSIKLENPMNVLPRCMSLFDDDSVYLGTPGGLFKLSIDDKTPRLVSNFKYYITSITANQDTLLIGTARNGFFSKVGNTVKHFSVDNNSIKLGWTGAITSYQKYTFIANEKNVFQLVNDSLKKINLQNKLESDFAVTTLNVNNRKELLIGTASSGILIYDLVQQKVIWHLKTPQLSSNTINFIKKINGYLWIGTNKGVDIIEGNDSSFTVYNLSNISTLGGAETSLIAIEEVEDKVWIGTIAGIISVPKNIIEQIKNNDQSQTIIETVTYGEKNIVYPIKNNNSISKLEIPYSTYDINIAFNSMQFDNKNNVYYYKLVNYDRQINKAQNSKLATYKRLPPGDYTFEVWEDNPFPSKRNVASFKLSIIPPFYKTTYFIVGIILIALFILLFSIKKFLELKEKQLLVQEQIRNEVRNEIAIDFHDEMGNHLAKIINLSGILKLQEIPSQFVSTVDKIEENTKKLFSSTSSFIWSLKSQNNNIHEIFFLINEFSESLFHNTDTNLRFFNNLKKKPKHLNVKMSRDLTLIIKELLTNIYKHASARNVSITFSDDTDIVITIVDDGVGFIHKEDVKNGGLSHIHHRSKRSGIEIDFNSRTEGNSGTKIILKINQHV